MPKKIIELPCFNIVVTLDGDVGLITDSLHEELHPENAGMGDGEYESAAAYNNSIDGITSLILAHACAGIDIETPAYIEGIETAVEACEQHSGEEE